MRRVPPSVLIREELDRLLTDDAGPGENLISELVQTVTRLVVQQLLEAEQRDLVGGWGRYQPRDDEAGHRGWRNGYLDGAIRTAEGKIPASSPSAAEACIRRWHRQRSTSLPSRRACFELTASTMRGGRLVWLA